MQIIMMGTGPFAAPTLRALYDSRHSVAALMTQPARPHQGKGPPPVNPMRELASGHGTQVLDPETINTDAARSALARFQPDLFVVCDYGQILAPETLAVARLGGINLHASLLPKYRGAAPIQWAIYHGETETGVTVIHMTPRIDAGPAIAQLRTPIGPAETAEQLEPRLAELGAPLVVECITALDAGTAEPIEQDRSQATRAPRLKKTDGEVNWSRPAVAIRNQVRAMKPWPNTFTQWLRSTGEPMRLILEQVTVAPATATAQPGTVIEATGERLIVATGQDALSIEQLQPAGGKRVMTTANFLRGHAIQLGERFGQS